MPRGAGVHPRCSETVSGSPWNGSPSAHSKSTPASGPGATIVSAVPATKARRDESDARSASRIAARGPTPQPCRGSSRAAQLRRTRGLSTVQPQLACWAREQHAVNSGAVIRDVIAPRGQFCGSDDLSVALVGSRSLRAADQPSLALARDESEQYARRRQRDARFARRSGRAARARRSRARLLRSRTSRHAGGAQPD